MINKIDHIGIAVKNLEEALKLYTEVLGLKAVTFETLEEQKVKTAIIDLGESKIELLEPLTADSPLASFIEKRGEGLHHLALNVANIETALNKIKEKNIPLVNEHPRKGVQNTRVGFVHPKGAKFILELVED